MKKSLANPFQFVLKKSSSNHLPKFNSLHTQGIPYDIFAEECRFFQLPEEVILNAKPKDFKCEVNKEDNDKTCEVLTLKEKIWVTLQVDLQIIFFPPPPHFL